MPLVLDLLLFSCASFATGYVRLKDFTVKVTDRRAELDVQMNQTLSPNTTNALSYTKCLLLFGNLITQVFLRGLQCGIVVVGFIDAFVYAHHQHRRSTENPGNFWDCLKGRIRFMTAITSADAHAHQETRHMLAVPRLNFRLPKPQARYPHLPNVRTTTRERGNDFQGWAIYTDGRTRHVNGETLAGWGVIARSPHGKTLVFFLGPVITAEAHPAFSGARTHSNTAEMTAVIEALSFLGPRDPVARDANSCIYYDSKLAVGVYLGTIQARTHVQLARACQQSMLSVQHRLRFTMHVYGHTGNLGNECADHAAALGKS